MLRLTLLDHAFRRTSAVPSLSRFASAPPTPEAVPSTPEFRDVWTTLQVKARLLGRLGADALSINVDTHHGRVTLHGLLTSTLTNDLALEAARSVESVEDVDNLLRIDDALDERMVIQRDDERLSARIANKLEADPRLAGATIDVRSVRNGVVLLGGTLSWYEDALVAQQSAYTFSGVRAVHTNFDFDGPESEPRERIAELDHVPASLTAEPRTSERRLRDGWITARVKRALADDDRVNSKKVHVDVHRGVATLFGVVGNRTEQVVARTLAARARSVRGIYDDLCITDACNEEHDG